MPSSATSSRTVCGSAAPRARRAAARCSSRRCSRRRRRRRTSRSSRTRWALARSRARAARTTSPRTASRSAASRTSSAIPSTRPRSRPPRLRRRRGWAGSGTARPGPVRRGRVRAGPARRGPVRRRRTRPGDRRLRLLHRSTRSRPRGGGRAVVAIATISVAAAALYVGALRGLSPVESAMHVPWWALAVPFLLAEAYPLHLQFQSETTTLTLSEVGLVLGFFAASPGEMLLAQLCGALIALVAIRRQRPLKVAFNLAQLGLSSCIALVVFRRVAGLGETHGPAGGLGALAGAAAFSVATVMLVTAMIAIAAGHSVRRELPHVSLLALIGSLATASLVVAAVELVTNDAWAAWLLLLPAASCALAFRAYGTQGRRHEHLEFLYQSMRATQGAPEFRAALRELAVAARAMLAAEFAEIVLTSPANDGALRCVIGPDDAEVIETSVLTDSDLLALGHASAQDRPVLLPRGREPHTLDPYLGERGIGDGMVAALRRDDRIFGMLLVGDRAGDVSTFNEDDRKLIETFASHAGVLLENDRVKEQLRYQAFHDALTGLPNRTRFAERVGDALQPHSIAAGTSVTSRRSTTASATAPATSCWPRSPSGSGRASAPATRPRAWAETNSASCSSARAQTRPCGWRRASSRRCARRSSCTAARWRSTRASASPRAIPAS